MIHTMEIFSLASVTFTEEEFQAVDDFSQVTSWVCMLTLSEYFPFSGTLYTFLKA